MRKTAKELKDGQIARIIKLATELQKKGFDKQSLSRESCVTRIVWLEQLEREYAAIETVTFNPEPGDGISCGSVEMIMTPYNIKCMELHTIVKLNYEMGNSPIDENKLWAMNEADRKALLNELKLTRQSKLN